MNKPNRIIWAAFFGLLLLSIQAYSQCANSLLTNPGFESGLTGWTTVGTVTATTDAHTGIKAAQGGGSGYTSVGQALVAVPGTTYTASAWIKGNCVLELRYMNANWARIENAGLLSSVNNSSYQLYNNTAIAPAGAAYVYLLVYKDQGTGFKVDDACLVSGGGGPACAITPTISNIACSNNNTPNNPNDDIYSFIVNATNPAGGAGYQIFIPQLSATYNGTYGSQLFIQNVSISTGNLTLNFIDNMTANCSATATVTAPPPCSVPGQPDLSGNVHEIIPAVNNCFTPPGQSNMYVSMQINNIGDVAATAFKVKFYLSPDVSLSADAGCD